MLKNLIRPIRIEGKVAFVPLTQGYEAVINSCDVLLVDKWNWFALVRKNTVYAMRKSLRDANGKQKNIPMHRVVMDAPDGMQVDHIDGNGLDNRRKTNLRMATRQQNSRNRRIGCNNTSGVKGVTWSKKAKKWRTMIMLNNKLKHLGYFTEQNLAAAAYAKASKELHGEFGRLE
jgi:hypothetical protein